MDGTLLFDELVHRLNLDDGSADGLPDRTGVVLRGWRGRDLDPPYMLHVDPPMLGEHLRSMEAAGRGRPGQSVRSSRVSRRGTMSTRARAASR
jgi:hypothetical protein